MVIVTPRRARPLLAVAAVLFLGLVVLPTASRADFEPANYSPSGAPSDQNSTLEDALIALGIAGLTYVVVTK